MDVAINNITTTITVPQVDFNLLKELAKKFGWVIQTEKKSGIEEALEDVKAGRVYHAKDAHDLIKQCLEWGIWECHITPDWLMLWEQNDEKLTLLFLNNGTHSDLF